MLEVPCDRRKPNTLHTRIWFQAVYLMNKLNVSLFLSEAGLFTAIKVHLLSRDFPLS